MVIELVKHRNEAHHVVEDLPCILGIMKSNRTSYWASGGRYHQVVHTEFCDEQLTSAVMESFR